MTSVATYRFAESPDQVSGVQFRYTEPTRLKAVAVAIRMEHRDEWLGFGWLARHRTSEAK